MRKLMLLAGAAALLTILSIRQGALAQDVVVRLLLGWCWYLARVVPQLTIARDGVITALVCLALFTAGLHPFLRWLWREIPPQGERAVGDSSGWSGRATLALVTIVIVMFVAGISATGVVHQVGWILKDKQPRTRLRPDDSYSGASIQHLGEMGMVAVGRSWDDSPLRTARFDGQGRQLHSWQTALLAFFPLGARTYGQIDHDLPWDHPRNAAFFRGVVPDYLNPEVVPIRNPEGYALSHYAGNRHVLGRRRPLSSAEVARGASNTVLAGEVASGFRAWGDPENLRDPARGFYGSPEAFGNPSGTGANMLFLDGSVRFLRSTTSPAVLRQLSRPSRASD